MFHITTVGATEWIEYSRINRLFQTTEKRSTDLQAQVTGPVCGLTMREMVMEICSDTGNDDDDVIMVIMLMVMLTVIMITLIILIILMIITIFITTISGL